MKKITVFFFLLLSVMLQAQVGVNTTTPDPSSMLDIAATNKGVLVPRVSLANVTTTMLDGTNTAATGLLIWNTNAATVGGNGVGFYFFNGTQWIPITQTITGNTLDQSYDQGGAGVGKNINATDGAVRINGDDGFLVTGTFGTGNIIDTEVVGNGARMFFNPRKAAFRAGFAEDTRWNDASIGDYSFAVNRRSLASGFASVSLGYDSEAVGNYSFVAGYNSAVSSDYGVVFGRDSYVNSGSNNGVVFGYSSNVYNNYGWAVGEQADTYGEYGFAKGLSVTSRSFGETVFGFFNTDYTPNSLTGYNAADRLFVLGNGTNASNLSNALTIFKDGRMNINDAYTMPTIDGTNGQVMQTNGAGNVSWATPSTGTDDQNLVTPTLVGTTLNLNIENGTGTSIDLAPLQDGIGTDNQTIDNFSLSGTTLRLSLENDGQPLQTVNLASLSGTDDQNLVTPTLTGTTLNLNIENGTGTSIDLAPLQDGIGTDDQTIDNFSLSGTTLRLSLENDGQPLQTVNLASINTDNQNLVAPTLVGTTLNLNIENGTGTSIDLAPLQDGTGTDNQTLALAGNNLSISGGNTVNLSALNTDDQNLVTPTLVGTTLNLNIENGLGTSIDLAPLQDGTGTDDQTIDNFSLSGTTLRLSLENDGQPLQTVNLASLAGTDDQNLVTPTLVGTTLNLNIENGTGTSIDLEPLQDGIGTDDQTIDNFSLSGTTLRLSLENDGQPLQTVNLASINTDDQNLVTPTLVGTTLNLNIENGTGTSIDLAPLQDGTGTDNQTLALAGNNLSISGGNTVNLSTLNTDDQNLVTPTLVGTTLNLNIENGTGTSIDLAPLRDHDWYEVGGTNAPNSITDNKFTFGNVLIGKNNPGLNNAKLDVENNDRISTLTLLNNYDPTTSTIRISGILNTINSTENASGIENILTGNSLSKTGVVNDLSGNMTSGLATGVSTRYETTGANNQIAVYNTFASTLSTGSVIKGVRNWFQSGSNYTATLEGIANDFNNNNNGENIGTTNTFTGTGTGLKYGTRNSYSGIGNGGFYGSHTEIINIGTGNKYGDYINILNTSGGIHYGIYSDVTKSNSFAGYFLGRLSIGTTTANNYILPSSRGTNGQIMQTDGVGNVSWVNSPTTESTTANNGLTQIADNIQLGGTLIQNTFITQGVNSLDINLNSTGDFAIQDNGTDVFFVEDTGDIGIGTSNPVYPLHIVENVAATTQGVYIDKTDNTTVETSGLYIQKTGTGTGRSHAIYTNVDGTGTGQKYGIFNNITSNAIGNQYGTRNYINSATSSFIFGTFNNLDNAGTGNQYGVYNGMRGTSAANLYGTYNEFNSPSIAIETAGVYNSFSDGTPGTSGIMGVYSEFSNPSNGTYYGVRNAYTAAATGTGIKYGTYNLIPAAAGGTHYGTFNSVDVSNGWAGYFVGRSYFSDRLSVGETNNVNAAISINKNSTGTYSHIELKESVADDGARIRFTNAAELTNEWVLFGRADNTNSDSSFNIFNNVSGNVVVVNGDGRVGIMRTPATNALEVNGNASKNVAGGFLANSDIRLKKDISTISPNDALEKILKLRGVTYHWNDDKTGTTRPENLQMGFIAQEIAEVFPEKVTEDNLGYLQTAYGDYDPIVFQAVKALNDKIEKLEKENATLKSIVEKVNALEAKLDQMNLK